MTFAGRNSVGRYTGLPDARPSDGWEAGPGVSGGHWAGVVRKGVQVERVLLEVVEQLPGSHELFDYLVRDLLAPGLVLCDQGLQDLHELLLELPSEHGSAGVILPEERRCVRAGSARPPCLLRGTMT